MTTKSAFSAVGLAHKVCLSAEQQGYTPELLNALAEAPDLFRQLLQVQRGHAVIATVEHLIDCDSDPFVPNGWKVEDHQKGGSLKWDPSKVALYLSARQKKGSIWGNELRKELARKPILNANVLDYLLAHPELIPESWENRQIVFFWGTVYRNSDGGLCVRCLYWRGDSWDWGRDWLDRDWEDGSPAVLRKLELGS